MTAVPPEVSEEEEVSPAQLSIPAGQVAVIVVVPVLIIGVIAVVWTLWSRRSKKLSVEENELLVADGDILPATILIVEDDPASTTLLERYLILAGFQVEVASDGVGAIQVARKKQPDLLIMDALMPNMDGFETSRRIREIDSLANVPIIMVTALDGMENKIKAFEAHIDDYITKPFDQTDLILRVAALLRRSRLGRNAAASSREGPSDSPDG